MTTRDRLEYLFNNSWEEAVFQQKWAEFAARTDHTVRIIDPPISDLQRWLIPKMNCFTYALGLYNLPEYSRWIREQNALWVFKGDFVDALIEQEILVEIKDTEQPVGSLIVYHNGETITHMGTIITQDKRVRSKRNIFEFYEHGLTEVQMSYGDPIKFLEQPSDDAQKTIMEALWQ